MPTPRVQLGGAAVLAVLLLFPLHSTGSSFQPGYAGFSVRFKEEVNPYSVLGVFVLPEEALTRIRDAMLAHPELVSGDRRQFDTDLMRAVPGRLVAKGGAEGLRSVGVLAGVTGGDAAAIGMAVKIEDGDAARRAGPAATCEALRQVGVLGEVELSQLDAYARPDVLDLSHGERVGEVRPAFAFERA